MYDLLAYDRIHDMHDSKSIYFVYLVLSNNRIYSINSLMIVRQEGTYMNNIMIISVGHNGQNISVL